MYQINMSYPLDLYNVICQIYSHLKNQRGWKGKKKNQTYRFLDIKLEMHIEKVGTDLPTLQPLFQTHT